VLELQKNVNGADSRAKRAKKNFPAPPGDREKLQLIIWLWRTVRTVCTNCFMLFIVHPIC